MAWLVETMLQGVGSLCFSDMSKQQSIKTHHELTVLWAPNKCLMDVFPILIKVSTIRTILAFGAYQGLLDW